MQRIKNVKAVPFLALMGLLAALALVAVACGGDDDEVVPTPTTVAVITEPEPAAPEPATIEIWWAGEEETPGVEAWIDETIELYEAANPHITIKATRQTTDSILPTAQSAVAAQQGPDIQFYWGIPWFLEDMWADQLTPLDDYIPEEVAHYLPFQQKYASWKGKTYASPLYNIGYPWLYNKRLFEQAGLDPDKAPQNWEEMLAAGEALKAAGITPIAMGTKDNWGSDWPWLEFQPMTVASEKDFMDLFLGVSGEKFTDPEHVVVWEYLQELIEKDFFPDDVSSLEILEGWDLFPQEKAAMVMAVEGIMIGWAEQMGGVENVGVFLTPLIPEAQAFAKKFQTGSAYLAIYHWSEVKEEAADFIKFTHTPERMQAMYDSAGNMMGDDRFQRAWIPSEIGQQIYDWTYDEATVGQSLYHVAWPTLVDWTWVSVSNLFAGTVTPEELGAEGQRIVEAWRKERPDQVDSFKQWIETSGLGD